MGICNCSMFSCILLCVLSSFAITYSEREREGADCFALFVFLVLLSVVWLFLTVQRVCLQFVIVVFPTQTHLLFLHFDVLSGLMSIQTI